MKNSNIWANLVALPALAIAAVISFAGRGETANTLKVSCDRQTSIPTVVATFSNQARSQVTPILSFLPQYFSPQEASLNCNSTAQKLDAIYSQSQMNYLASDTINKQPVVCTVSRRGSRCDSYNSQILFSLKQPVSPTDLLYDMLGKDFKGSQVPSSRTVSRIYTDLKQPWWPFPF